MKTKFYVVARENGTIIDSFSTREKAERVIKKFEESDKNDGFYEEDFYEIIEDIGG